MKAPFAIIFAALAAGCDMPERQSAEISEPTTVGYIGRFVEMEHKGHTYLVFDFTGADAGGAICHAENCRCKTK